MCFIHFIELCYESYFRMPRFVIALELKIIKSILFLFDKQISDFHFS